MPHDDEVSQQSLPDVLRRFRGAMSQQELAEKAGVTPGMIGHAERGTRSLGVETIGRIADALKLTPSQHAELRAARDRQSRKLSSKPAPAAPPAGVEARLDQLSAQLAEVTDIVTANGDAIVKLLVNLRELSAQRAEGDARVPPMAAGE